MNKSNPETRLIHTPYDQTDPYNALSMPVYNSVAYSFDTAEAMEEAFCGRSADHTYSRITNPTVAYFEKKVAELTGAHSVTALNSGMAAIANTFMTLAAQGSNIVTSPHLFGNTYSFFSVTLARFGVEVRFCDLTDPQAITRMMDDRTCAVYLEVLTNPQLEIADLRQLSALARKQGVPLIADTTVVPFTHFHASEWGIDIEIVSSTKYISGGATSLGGLIIDYGSFDWSASATLRNALSTPQSNAFTTRLRREVHRNLGAYMTPQVAYMQSLGLETLALRFARQSSTCLALARKLRDTDGIRSVNYTALPGNPFHDLSQTQFGDYPGAMLTFDLDSRDACFAFLNRLQLICRATNLFDNRSLAIHPASTIYGTYTPEQRQRMHISERTIRLSVGLETIDDLYADIRQALLTP